MTGTPGTAGSAGTGPRQDVMPGGRPRMRPARAGAVTAVAVAVGIAGLLAAAPARAQLFDWSWLDGQWAESTRHLYGCRPDNLHHAFVVSDDRKTLTFALDRPWKIGTGQEVRAYRATITGQSEWSLFIRYGDELPGLDESMRAWELRFIGPGTYRWRSLAWAPGEFNDVIGVRCR